MGIGAQHAEPDDRDRRESASIQPWGRRLLTLEQVAQHLQVDVRIVRKLVRLHDEERDVARAEGRLPRPIGLRAVRVSPRCVRVSERDLGAFLARPRRQ